jgi:hypothetical protein
MKFVQVRCCRRSDGGYGASRRSQNRVRPARYRNPENCSRQQICERKCGQISKVGNFPICQFFLKQFLIRVVDRQKKVLANQEEQLKQLVAHDEKLTDEVKLIKQTAKDCQAAVDAERKKMEKLRNAPAASDVKVRTMIEERKILEEEAKEIEPALDEVTQSRTPVVQASPAGSRARRSRNSAVTTTTRRSHECGRRATAYC